MAEAGEWRSRSPLFLRLEQDPRGTACREGSRAALLPERDRTTTNPAADLIEQGAEAGAPKYTEW
jgi:hypothetical protein